MQRKRRCQEFGAAVSGGAAVLVDEPAEHIDALDRARASRYLVGRHGDLAENRYEAALQKQLQFIEANLRDGMTLRQVNDLEAESNATQSSAKVGLNGALTALAGSECTATPP